MLGMEPALKRQQWVEAVAGEGTGVGAGAGAGKAIIHSYSHVYLTMLFTLHAKCKRIKTSVRPSVRWKKVPAGMWQVAATSQRVASTASGNWQLGRWLLAGGRWQVAAGRHQLRRLPSCWKGSDAACSATLQVAWNLARRVRIRTSN